MRCSRRLFLTTVATVPAVGVGIRLRTIAADRRERLYQLLRRKLEAVSDEMRRRMNEHTYGS